MRLCRPAEQPCWLNPAPEEHPSDCHLLEERSQQGLLQENHMYKKDSDTYDIYLLPPGEDVETCTSWLRMRNRDGRYNLMFEEWVTDGPFIISPRITFEVRPTATAAASQRPFTCHMLHASSILPQWCHNSIYRLSCLTS